MSDCPGRKLFSGASGPDVRRYSRLGIAQPSGQNLAFTLEQLVMEYRQLYRAACLQTNPGFDPTL